MRSSKAAAVDALWELFELAGKAVFGNGEVVFKSYAKMQLIKMPRSTYYTKLKRFERYGLISGSKVGEGRVFIITSKAKALRRKPAAKNLRKDGFSSLIIFDIPEEKHNARDTFRRFLIRNGYTQIKESCFVSPFSVSEDLKELVRELKLEKNISFFSAKLNNLFG